MIALLLALKLAHIVAATLAVGANATYLFWLRAGGRDPERLAFSIGGIRRLDKLIAIPAFGTLFVTGLLTLALGVYDFTRGWILLAIVLYLGLAVAGMTVMGPALKRVLAEAERDPTSEAFATADRASWRYTMASLGVLLIIVTLMVVKPF
jgi:uncharacterized membrane protein